MLHMEAENLWNVNNGSWSSINAVKDWWLIVGKQNESFDPIFGAKKIEMKQVKEKNFEKQLKKN